jgi:Asp-tRNA(Asn)/Glu-tRNA(Gln) amidotransferase C subunit
LRRDRVERSDIAKKEMLANAPDVLNDFIKVKSVFGNGNK